MNPPNDPHARAIEKCWHQKLSREAKTEQQLIRHIESKIKILWRVF